MANRTLANLEQEIADVTARYESDFAGQARATRDLAVMDELLNRLRSVVAELEKQAKSDGVTAALEQARGRLSMYQTERQAIVDAKAGGTEAVEFARLAAQANFVFARYQRHFAGQSRGTRDLGLLKEMVEELRTIRQRMSVILSVKPNTSYQTDADLVTRVVDQYTDETRQIERAQSEGSPEERASRLADLANAQFAIYDKHFVEKSRITRRPALLQRVVENLRRIRSSMRELKLSGPAVENNRNNIGIVEQALRHNESELAEIRKARQAAPLADIMGMLGGAANDIFEEYRQKFAGKDRRMVDLTTISLLCDQLGEVARQMADMTRTEKNEMNERNLDIVIERLSAYEEEWRAIREAQQAPKK
ncbi:MAG TPA: hypothetical protein PKI03_00615 [Pseudomonadota bacterium]|nr:hypothetical protein [Pseudomonadota bacterium]